MAIDVMPAVLAGQDDDDRHRQLAYREAITAFADVAVALREAIDRDELLHLTARKMSGLIGVSRCSLYLREEDTGFYRGQVGHADQDIDEAIKRLVIGGIEADTFTREIIRTREPVVMQDALHDARAVRSTIRTWRVRSMMGVPMVLRDEVIGIFLLDSEEKTRRFTEVDQDLASAFAELAAAAISQAELIGELRQSRDTVSRQNKAFRRATAVDDRFTELVIRGGSLREIAAAVTELTKKHCVIYDSRMQYLTSAGEDEDGGQLDQAVLEAPEVAAVPADRPTAIGPFPKLGIYSRLLVSPVTVSDARWASLVMVEQGSPFNAFDMLIARRVASIIALEMSAERRATLAEWNARSSLAAELIRGNRDVAHVERRADFLGLRLDQPHVVCLVTWRDGDELQLPDAEAVAAEVSRCAGGVSILATGVVEGIALIIDLPEGKPTPTGIEEIKEHVRTACGALDPHGRLVAGLSMRCVSAADYVRAYEQTRQVVSCIDMYCPSGEVQVLSADDLGPGRLLLAGTEPAEARRFTEEALGALLDDDVPSELLQTLVCFFESGRSVRRSATTLGVHENTIRYRLTRVEELTGLDIGADCDAQLSAQIALLVLRLQGALPPSVTAGAEPVGDAEADPSSAAEDPVPS
jgi:sugar diacid utilization regulator